MGNCKSTPRHEVEASMASSPGPISERPLTSTPRSPTRKGRLGQLASSILRRSSEEQQSPNTRRQRPRRGQDAATSPSPLADAQQQQQHVSFLPTTNTAPSSSTNNQSALAAATSSNNGAVSSTPMDIDDTSTAPSSSTNIQSATAATATSSTSTNQSSMETVATLQQKLHEAMARAEAAEKQNEEVVDEYLSDAELSGIDSDYEPDETKDDIGLTSSRGRSRTRNSDDSGGATRSKSWNNRTSDLARVVTLFDTNRRRIEIDAELGAMLILAEMSMEGDDLPDFEDILLLVGEEYMLPVVTPEYYDLVKDLTSLESYKKGDAVWNGSECLVSGTRKEIIHFYLRDLFQVKTGITSCYVVGMPKCPKYEDCNAEAHTSGPGRQMRDNVTYRAIQEISRAIPQSNINYMSELNFRVHQSRRSCRRTSNNKHCERIKPPEVDDNVEIIERVDQYCRDMKVPMLILGIGGRGMDPLFAKLHPLTISATIAPNGPHPSTLNAWYPNCKTAENAMVKVTSWINPISVISEHFFTVIVPKSCDERDIADYIPPPKSIMEVLEASDEAVFVGKDNDEDAVAKANVRISEQCRRAGKKGGLEAHRLEVLASDAVVSGTAGRDESQRVLNRASADEHLEFVVKGEIVYRSIKTPTLVIDVLAKQGFGTVTKEQIWSAAGIMKSKAGGMIPKHKLLGCIDVNVQPGMLNPNNVGWNGDSKASIALLRSVNIGDVAGEHWAKNVLAKTGLGFYPDTSDMHWLRYLMVTELVKSVQDEPKSKKVREQVKKAMSKVIALYRKENTATSSIIISVVSAKEGPKPYNKGKGTMPTLYGARCNQYLVINSSSDYELMFGGKGGNSKKGLAHVILQILQHCYNSEFENTADKKKNAKKKKILILTKNLWNGEDYDSDSDSDSDEDETAVDDSAVETSDPVSSRTSNRRAKNRVVYADDDL